LDAESLLVLVFSWRVLTSEWAERGPQLIPPHSSQIEKRQRTAALQDAGATAFKPLLLRGPGVRQSFAFDLRLLVGGFPENFEHSASLPRRLHNAG
jgi:hypothetical protein